MSLKTGNWQIDGNGHKGVLQIRTVDAQGKLTGTAYGQQITGLWDEASQQTSFMRLISPGNPSSYQVFVGYLYYDLLKPGDPPSYRHTLTGYFDAFQGGGGSAQRSRYGWSAHFDGPAEPSLTPIRPLTEYDSTRVIGSWGINTNGLQGGLDLQAVDAQNNLTGTAYGQQIIGFWNGASQEIKFMIPVTPGNPSSYQFFTGYFFEINLGGVNNPAQYVLS